jgi:hypothetical protein
MKPIGENKADIDERLYRTIRIQCDNPEHTAAWIASNYNHIKTTYFKGLNTMKRYGTREDLFQQTILKLITDALH